LKNPHNPLAEIVYKKKEEVHKIIKVPGQIFGRDSRKSDFPTVATMKLSAVRGGASR